MAHVYTHPHPAVTVDCVVFGYNESELQVLLIERGAEPFQGSWALPGGFVRMDESLEQAALRELQEEAGLHEVFLEQLYTFGKPDRDPRERVISVAYYALVKLSDHRLQAATDARDVQWFPLAALPRLAFDHAGIVEMALARLQAKVRYEPIGFELLPPKFTLTQIQNLYENVLQVKLDKRNFRKKLLATGLLIPLDEMQAGMRHRAARLHRFDATSYRRLKKAGLNFEL